MSVNIGTQVYTYTGMCAHVDSVCRLLLEQVSYAGAVLWPVWCAQQLGLVPHSPASDPDEAAATARHHRKEAAAVEAVVKEAVSGASL
jgi:hypothetical protein